MATIVVPASSRRGIRMKKIAKMIPRNSSSVSVRQTGRFSLAFHGLFHLIRPRSHRRSSATIIRFSTNAMQIPINSGESRSSRLPSTPLIHFPVQQCRKGDQQHDPLDVFLVQVQSHPALRSCYTIYYHVLCKVSMQKAAQSGKFL